MRRAQREEQFFTQAPVDYIMGWVPVERTDTVVYTWPDAEYTIPVEWRAANEVRRHEVINEEFVTLRQMTDMIEAQREQERMIETLVQERYRDRVDYEDFTERPDPSGVTLLRESDYFRMEWEWRLDPSAIYYTYPDTDNGLTATWTERRPKITKVTYFIE